MTEKYINLGCGPIFIDSSQWINLDFAPSNKAIHKANLLGTLPLKENSASVVYSSHFFEHIPRSCIQDFLKECFRVLKPNGVLRFVLPDLENMVRTYLEYRENENHVKADFVVVEIIDQCVRSKPGGELGQLFKMLREKSTLENKEMINFIRERIGENLNELSNSYVTKNKIIQKIYKIPKALMSRLQRVWISLWLLGLPSAFRKQNISLTQIGERHQWLWDFNQLRTELKAAGFNGVVKSTANTSSVHDFPFYPLDLDTDGLPRKGNQSMFVEAYKP
jgi:SAM-dependent methyltransferase